VFKKVFRILVVIFLFTFIASNIISEYFIDLQGISIEGVYACKGKRLGKITLDRYYPPSEIWKKARSLGYSGLLHTGFGEPDDQGNGLYVDAQIKDRGYRLFLERTRDSEWKKIVVYSHRISNSCLVPHSVLKKDITGILDALGIDTNELQGLKFTHDYDLPWFTLSLL